MGRTKSRAVSVTGKGKQRQKQEEEDELKKRRSARVVRGSEDETDDKDKIGEIRKDKEKEEKGEKKQKPNQRVPGCGVYSPNRLRKEMPTFFVENYLDQFTKCAPSERDVWKYMHLVIMWRTNNHWPKQKPNVAGLVELLERCEDLQDLHDRYVEGEKSDNEAKGRKSQPLPTFEELKKRNSNDTDNKDGEFVGRGSRGAQAHADAEAGESSNTSEDEEIEVNNERVLNRGVVYYNSRGIPPQAPGPSEFTPINRARGSRSRARKADTSSDPLVCSSDSRYRKELNELLGNRVFPVAVADLREKWKDGQKTKGGLVSIEGECSVLTFCPFRIDDPESLHIIEEAVLDNENLRDVNIDVRPLKDERDVYTGFLARRK
ncbi:unnamed protein product [Periconia digitata]|uniref:Uncharacterized protein n=1 Tax=Periconia digitata TaxID=1303443 RepID=A0A9W4UAQ6_9PLEO|nr:unnamed protein product [Periconia digitata]